MEINEQRDRGFFRIVSWQKERGGTIFVESDI